MSLPGKDVGKLAPMGRTGKAFQIDMTERGDPANQVAALAERRVPWIQRLRWALGILRAYRYQAKSWDKARRVAAKI